MKGNNMRLSIIIPLYNAEKHIARCIDSCFFQELKEDDFEIIIINDGSTDKSLEVVGRFSALHTNIRVYSQVNQGQGAARNHGLDKAKGKYILFLDSDDSYLPKTIKSLVDLAEEKQCEVLNYLMEVERPDGSIEVGYKYRYDFNRVYSGEELLLYIGVSVGTVCSSLYRKSFILQYGLRFPIDMKHEDVYFSYQVYTHASKVIFSNIHSYFYHWNEGSTDRSTDLKKIKILEISDIKLAYHLKSMAEKDEICNKLACYLKKNSNSILISLLISIIKKKSLLNRKELKQECSLRQLYPMRGPANSWKTTILQPFFNLLLYF